MLAIAWIDALGRIAKPEVTAARQPRSALQLGAAFVLGHAGIDRAFINHRRTARGVDQARHGPRGRHQMRQIGAIIAVHRRRDGDDQHVHAATIRGIGRVAKGRLGEPRRIHLTRSVVPLPELVDPLRVDIEPDDVEMLRQRDGERKPDIAETNQRRSWEALSFSLHSNATRAHAPE